jgi:hypothetical protein
VKPAPLIVVTILIAASLIGWIRGGEGFPLPQAIPLCGGKSPSLVYDLLGGLGLVLVALWGLSRVARLGRRSQEPAEELEPEETSPMQEAEDDEPEEENRAEDEDEPAQEVEDDARR